MINTKPDLVLAETVRNVLKKASSLEKKGKLEKALIVLETVSNEIHNPSLPIANSIIIEIASICNKLFNRGGNDVLILRKAEMVLNHWKILNKNKSDMDSVTFNLMLLTLNNWATYHQNSHNYHMSLNYLMRAQKFMDEFQLDDPDSLEISAKTKLNICALYFELRRYKETIDFAKQALAILQLELRGRLGDSSYEDLDEEEQIKVQVMASSYVIAFYNIGAAHEALGNHLRMLEAFDNAVKIGMEFLPHDHELLSAAYVAKTEAQTLVKQFPTRPATKANTARESKRVVLTQKKSEDNQMLRCSTTPDLHKRSKSSRFPRINLQAPPSATLPLTERKEEVKYYSDKQLLRLQKKLQESQPKFVSADQYFYNKISKNLNISRDIKYLKELNA